MNGADSKVRDAELTARAALGNHDPDAWSLVHAALERRAMVAAARTKERECPS